MQQTTLGRTGIVTSVVGFGGIMLNNLPQPEADRIVAKALDAGVTYFDVAPSYGDAQYKLGPALAGRRDDVTLACKTHNFDGPGALCHLEESLKALKTDHFDIYQLHALDDPASIALALGPGGALEALVHAREQGKIRFIGFSCHRERSALYLMDQFDFDSILHPIQWACMIHGDKGRLALQAAEKRNMVRLALKALSWRPVAEGEEAPFPNCWYVPIHKNPVLAGLALRYTLSQPVHVAISPGAEEMLDLMLKLMNDPKAMTPLDEAEMETLKAEAAKVAPLFKD